MKNYLTILGFAAISFCLICGGCQPEETAKDEITAARPSMQETAPVKVEAKKEPKAEVKSEIAVEPKAEAAASARSGRSRKGRGLYGDWDVKMDYDGNEYKSILSFSREEDKLIGHWISFWGMNELQDIEFEDDKLSFVQTYKGWDGQSRVSNFTGTIKGGKIYGTVSSDMGETELNGKRSKRISAAVGSWAMTMKGDEHEFTSTLVVTAKEKGKLAAEWQSQRGEHEITDVSYERGKLTFKQKSKMEEHQWESTFEGNIKRGRNILSGVITSEHGELAAEGKLVGASVIGKWDLEVESERGTRKQRLQVNPDMSGLYGTIAIEKINLEGDKVSFETVLEFGEQKYDMSFEGKIEGSKLSGELTTSRGTRKIKGTKVVPRYRRSRT